MGAEMRYWLDEFRFYLKSIRPSLSETEQQQLDGHLENITHLIQYIRDQNLLIKTIHDQVKTITEEIKWPYNPENI